MPSCFEASGSVRTRANIQCDSLAFEVQIFWPLTTQKSPSSSARVRSEARSEPEPGSLYPWHQTILPSSVSRTNFCFCASVPCSTRVGASMLGPWPTTSHGALAARNSSAMMALLSGSKGCSPPP